MVRIPCIVLAFPSFQSTDLKVGLIVMWNQGPSGPLIAKNLYRCLVVGDSPTPPYYTKVSSLLLSISVIVGPVFLGPIFHILLGWGLRGPMTPYKKIL